ncbi:MAG: hypothetical protein B655_1733 [Methanobacterium sp. Maddingley MBC34]|nr:MAG: hypothetical protein B655_1733 [Methanobacterium sp. Maddingley MBC34]
MIRIVSSKKKLDQTLEELELEYSKGNISKKEYFAQKRDIGQELETLQAAEHVRRMQGRLGSEKSLDYWSDQEDEKKKLADEAEKQEMLKKYITKPESIKGKDMPSREWFGKRAKIGLLAFVILAFVVGTSMGSMLITKPSETPQIAMAVNASAFLPTPVNNTTTTTSNITKTTTTTDTTPTTTTTETTPTTTTDTSSNSQTNTQTDTNTGNKTG